MIDPPDVSTAPSRRHRRSRVALLVIVVALVIAIPAILLGTRPSCGCTSPTDLAIINYAREDVGVSWQGPGLFGTRIFGISGSETALACTVSSYSLRPGGVDVSMSDASDALSVHLDIPSGGGRSAQAAVVVISADGQIADPVHQPPAGTYPEDPLCH